MRHPDMPEEAFRDMWATIQDRLPWTGLVKNRRKNGDYYWVRANATPMVDGDQITGFLSVRTSPSQADVATADALYQRLQAQAKDGSKTWGLQHGEVVRRDLWGRCMALLRPGAVAQMVWLQLWLAAAVIGAAVLELRWPVVAAVALVGGGITVWSNWAMRLRPLVSLVQDANHLAAGDLSHVVGTGGRGLGGAVATGTGPRLGQPAHRSQ
ncbi:PAS domain-containing protein [Rhodoferax sp.]|uniref:PAS domain-containing protein n=1 Tax=Rhodoferax sp. TaxID=50421 RepID=UPI002ACE9179|nr:PAS domain-containing protein [Rhodoferax sp.]MDZ7921328.1 PAS domain-containing protein [Rhodoferax sp.]